MNYKALIVFLVSLPLFGSETLVSSGTAHVCVARAGLAGLYCGEINQPLKPMPRFVDEKIVGLIARENRQCVKTQFNLFCWVWGEELVQDYYIFAVAQNITLSNKNICGKVGEVKVARNKVRDEWKCEFLHGVDRLPLPNEFQSNRKPLVAVEDSVCLLENKEGKVLCAPDPFTKDWLTPKSGVINYKDNVWTFTYEPHPPRHIPFVKPALSCTANNAQIKCLDDGKEFLWDYSFKSSSLTTFKEIFARALEIVPHEKAGEMKVLKQAFDSLEAIYPNTPTFEEKWNARIFLLALAEPFFRSFSSQATSNLMKPYWDFMESYFPNDTHSWETLTLELRPKVTLPLPFALIEKTFQDSPRPYAKEILKRVSFTQ